MGTKLDWLGIYSELEKEIGEKDLVTWANLQKSFFRADVGTATMEKLLDSIEELESQFSPEQLEKLESLLGKLIRAEKLKSLN